MIANTDVKKKKHDAKVRDESEAVSTPIED
jgi:hypothetical protein